MKNKIFLLDNGSYPFDVIFQIGNCDKTLQKFSKKHTGAIFDKEGLEDVRLRGLGRTVMFPAGFSVIRIHDEKDHPNIAHEVFHAVEFLFDRVGIKHDIETSSEAYAYQMAYLLEQIYKKLNKK